MNGLREFLEVIEVSEPQSTEELLRRILLKSRQVTGAEAGTIFIVRGKGRMRRLEAINAQNDVVELEPKQFVVPMTSASIAGFTAITGETVFVDDLYAIPLDLPFTFDPTFDENLGYRSRSMLSFPLVNHERRVIGVVQLINRRDRKMHGPLPFAREQADLIVPFNHIVGSAIERAAMLERIAGQNVRLKQRNRQLKKQREHIAALRDQTEEAFQLSIQLLAHAAELHDNNTARHVERVNEYSFFVAQKLGLARDFCHQIRYSAQLHDVGKMSVDVAILRKDGPLNDAERTEMMRHPVFGHSILAASDRLGMAAEIALSHHERWDGSGYPNGAQGEEIPVSARIVALVDVYDALRSRRPYKRGFSHEEALMVILEGDGRVEPQHFDPRIHGLFADYHTEFNAIWSQLADL